MIVFLLMFQWCDAAAVCAILGHGDRDWGLQTADHGVIQLPHRSHQQDQPVRFLCILEKNNS